MVVASSLRVKTILYRVFVNLTGEGVCGVGNRKSVIGFLYPVNHIIVFPSFR